MQPGPPRRLGLHSESNVITAGVRGTSRKSPSTNSLSSANVEVISTGITTLPNVGTNLKSSWRSLKQPVPLPKSSVYSSMETKAALKNSGLINPLFTAEQLKNNPPSPSLYPLKGNNLPRSTEEQQGNPLFTAERSETIPPHSSLFKGKKLLCKQ